LQSWGAGLPSARPAARSSATESAEHIPNNPNGLLESRLAQTRSHHNGIIKKLGVKKFKLLFILACATTATSVSWAQTIGSSAQSLAYGMFAAGTGGTVTVSPSGRRSASGGVILLPSGSGSAALFSVTGTSSTTYAITWPADGVVSLTSGANTMAVNAFTSNPASTGQLSVGGSQTLSVGATLSVGGNQASGSYSGSFSVTVIYN
jgi:hypothetical protein